MRRTLTNSLTVVIALAALLAPTAQSASSTSRFDEAKAAFDSAQGQPETRHEGYLKAYAIWSELADEGDARSLYHVGIMHIYGLGGADFNQAIGIRKVREAAEAGYPVAGSLLGFLAETGDGLMVERRDDVALRWWRMGAEGNHCAAVRRMVRAYTNGELGLTADAAKASEWEARRNGCTKN